MLRIKKFSALQEKLGNMLETAAVVVATNCNTNAPVMQI